MNISWLKTVLVVILIMNVIILSLTIIFAEESNVTTTTSQSNSIIDQDFVNTLITLSPALFFLSICFKFLDLLRDALSFGGEK